MATIAAHTPVMNTKTAAKTFEIQPLGDYSLEESANFIDAWHQAPAEGGSMEGHLHLAFLSDGDWQPVGVCLTQNAARQVRGTIYGDAQVEPVERQVKRILSLDVDGRGWAWVDSSNCSAAFGRSIGRTPTRLRRGA